MDGCACGFVVAGDALGGVGEGFGKCVGVIGGGVSAAGDFGDALEFFLGFVVDFESDGVDGEVDAVAGDVFGYVADWWWGAGIDAVGDEDDVAFAGVAEFFGGFLDGVADGGVALGLEAVDSVVEVFGLVVA